MSFLRPASDLTSAPPPSAPPPPSRRHQPTADDTAAAWSSPCPTATFDDDGRRHHPPAPYRGQSSSSSFATTGPDHALSPGSFSAVSSAADSPLPPTPPSSFAFEYSHSERMSTGAAYGHPQAGYPHQQGQPPPAQQQQQTGAAYTAAYVPPPPPPQHAYDSQPYGYDGPASHVNRQAGPSSYHPVSNGSYSHHQQQQQHQHQHHPHPYQHPRHQQHPSYPPRPQQHQQSPPVVIREPSYGDGGYGSLASGLGGPGGGGGEEDLWAPPDFTPQNLVVHGPSVPFGFKAPLPLPLPSPFSPSARHPATALLQPYHATPTSPAPAVYPIYDGPPVLDEVEMPNEEDWEVWKMTDAREGIVDMLTDDDGDGELPARPTPICKRCHDYKVECSWPGQEGHGSCSNCFFAYSACEIIPASDATPIQRPVGLASSSPPAYMPPLPPSSSSAAANDEDDDRLRHHHRGTRTPPSWQSPGQRLGSGSASASGSSSQHPYQRSPPSKDGHVLPRQRLVQGLVETHPAVQSFGQAAAGFSGHQQQPEGSHRPILGLPGSASGRSQQPSATPTSFLSLAEQNASPHGSAVPASLPVNERPPLDPTGGAGGGSSSSSFSSRPSSPPRRPSEIEREMETLRSRVGELQMSAQRGLGRVQDELRQQQQEQQRRLGAGAGGKAGLAAWEGGRSGSESVDGPSPTAVAGGGAALENDHSGSGSMASSPTSGPVSA